MASETDHVYAMLQHTFKAQGGSVQEDKYQVSSEGEIYFARQITSQKKQQREKWITFRAAFMCTGDHCVPNARAFQSVNPGTFVAGKSSMVMYGGLGRNGQALGDIFYMDVEDQSTQVEGGAVQEISMPLYWYRSNEWCKGGKCARALCQSTTGQAEKESDSDRFKYCYDDRNGDGVSEFSYRQQCGADYFCAAPGKRYGHSTEKILVQGEATMLVMVGGESGDWGQDSQTLTMDVHLAYFTAAFATWSKVLVADKNGNACGDADGILCPQPRRDSSIKMMGNDGSSNGRLLMFGGLAAGALTTSSVGRAYLEGLLPDSSLPFDVVFIVLFDPPPFFLSDPISPAPLTHSPPSHSHTICHQRQEPPPKTSPPSQTCGTSTCAPSPSTAPAAWRFARCCAGSS